MQCIRKRPLRKGVIGAHDRFDIAVRILIAVRDLSVLDELGKLHARNDSGNVSGLIYLGEAVLEVLQSAVCCSITGSGNEGYVLISGLTGNLLHIGLMIV